MKKSIILFIVIATFWVPRFVYNVDGAVIYASVPTEVFQKADELSKEKYPNEKFGDWKISYRGFERRSGVFSGVVMSIKWNGEFIIWEYGFLQNLHVTYSGDWTKGLKK